VLDDPSGHVRYMLIASRAPEDRIAQRFPAAANGSSSSFVAVFTTPRYVLVRVPGRVGGAAR
jgi:hypothetical protein